MGVQTLSRFRQAPSPWREGNRFRLLNDGAEFYARMLEAIDAARAFVLLEMYLVESGTVASRFIDALLAAEARGVRVAALFDGFGSARVARGRSAACSSRAGGACFCQRARLAQATRELMRNHRKLLAWTATSPRGRRRAHRRLRRASNRPRRGAIHGPRFAAGRGGLAAPFAATWRKSGGEPVPAVVARSAPPWRAAGA
jgi:phosphatidylserine/phosphatidylglycerophosphate/cardiolipin synthase-like enzyme